jgi:hypothetical protein
MSLISNNPTLKELYMQAKNCEYEWIAGRFWQYYLGRLIFQNNAYVLSNQESRSGGPNDRTSVDLVVEILNQARGQFRRLLIIEIKHARVHPSTIRECKMQAKTACEKYRERNPNDFEPVLYALTCIGTRAKL